ncbi:nitronate monooxygenase [Humidisolicoccus flavus]|uniref:nitronate monooxygenase n=1 Tax=Humidisolicoccus flavus TaxID=3111414 RepID=UPI0032565B47
MAGGPSTTELVIAAARAGSFAQLAAGYKSVEALRTEIETVRAAAVTSFGVNLFTPPHHPISEMQYAEYASALAPEFTRLGLDNRIPPLQQDDDLWDEKLALLFESPVPVVSFTFSLPEPAVIDRFRSLGTITMQTVTNRAEALAASEAGIDVLLVQGFAAGGHSAVWASNALPAEAELTALVPEVLAVTPLPLVAAGGIADAADVTRALNAGAAAVSVGTAVLLAPEAGTSAHHRAALSDPAYSATELTRVFTGRYARALVNRFVRDHHAEAISGYPAVHHLTKPLRAAAARAGDPSVLNLWAGSGWKRSQEAPLAAILDNLRPDR